MRALYICGSLNQTKMMYAVSRQLPEFRAFFTPYYCDGYLRPILRTGILEWTVMGGRFLRQTLGFLKERGVSIDYEGRRGPYDLVVTCSDLIVPKNVRRSKLVLVQEGMTDPESILYHLVKILPLPRWLASTATTGLSDAYDLFCVASEGYRDLFVKKGVRQEKTRVTGIPNFDDCRSFVDNDFPHRDYVLAATSDRREVYRYENRRRFIDKVNRLARGRPIVFEFHPNENHDQARREVERAEANSVPHPRLLFPRKITQQHDIPKHRGLVVIPRVGSDQRGILFESDGMVEGIEEVMVKLPR